MDLFITTFESVIVLIGIGIIGFWIIQRKIIPGNVIGLLSPLALEIALPSLIFINIVSDFSPKDMPNWWQLPLWWCFFTVIAAALTFVLRFLSDKKHRSEFGITLFYQNGIFFPLAIISGMFPDEPEYLLYLFFFTLFFPAFLFSTYRFFFKADKKIKIDLSKIIHPVLIATIIAILLVLIGVQNKIPSPVFRIFILLGGMTIPLIMIILGGNIYVDFKKKGKIEYLEIIKFVVAKNIVFPLVFLVLLFGLKSSLTYPVALIILLQSAVPPVTAVPLVTERVGGNRAIVNQFIVGSFISSLVSIPAIIYLFELYFTI